MDDNPIDHMITAYVLKTYYQLWDVIVMESAVSALSYLDSCKENVNDLPVLIILDLDMPELNGIGFLEKFALYTKEFKEACKIVVLTGSEIIADLEWMKADPHVFELISKPLNKNALAGAIKIAP